MSNIENNIIDKQKIKMDVIDAQDNVVNEKY